MNETFLLIVNIVVTLAGLVSIYVKISERITRVETHVFHIMRSLDMKPRQKNLSDEVRVYEAGTD